MATNAPSIVIDIGSSSIKTGYSRAMVPQVIVESIVGTEKLPNITSTSKEKYIGGQAKHNKLLNLTYPIQRGVVRNSMDMEYILNFILEDQLLVSGEGQSFLVTETPQNTKEAREKMTQMMFENLNVASLYMANQGVLALAAVGYDTGVVLGSGHGVTYTVPIYKGYALTKETNRLELAGDDLTRYLIKLLDERGYPILSTTEHENVQKMKEIHCRVAVNDHEKDQVTRRVNPLIGYSLKKDVIRNL